MTSLAESRIRVSRYACECATCRKANDAEFEAIALSFVRSPDYERILEDVETDFTIRELRTFYRD